MTEWYGISPIVSKSNTLEPLLDNGWIPIPLLRLGIRQQLAVRLQQMSSPSCTESMQKKMQYVSRLKERPIAIGTTPCYHTGQGNWQQKRIRQTNSTTKWAVGFLNDV